MGRKYADRIVLLRLAIPEATRALVNTNYDRHALDHATLDFCGLGWDKHSYDRLRQIARLMYGPKVTDWGEHPHEAYRDVAVRVAKLTKEMRRGT